MSEVEQFKGRVSDALQTMGIACRAEEIERCLRFLALLGRWNRLYNLTALRRFDQMVTHHLLDSLAILPYLQGERVVDVGTGAGLPGVPLAIMNPERTFLLLDSNGKKTRFIKQATIELALGNVTTVTQRVEAYSPAVPFDTVITRAFAALPTIVALTAHLCAPGGRLLLMKGLYPQEELAQLPAGFVVSEVVRLQVPGVDAERHLVIISARSLSDLGGRSEGKSF